MHYVFEYTDEDLSLPEELEVQLLAVAQGRAATVGEADPEAARARLIEAYGPALRAAVSRYHGSEKYNGPVAGYAHRPASLRSTEDLQSAALVGILEAIEEHDPERHPRLAGTLVHHLNRALAEEDGTSFTVPTRTLSRFFGILRAAEGDPEEAERIAPDYEMSRETFRDLLAITSAQSLDGAEQGGSWDDIAATPLFAPSPIVDVEDRILVDMAFAAMADDELRICELYYGFTEYDPVPDAEIAHRTGDSRPTVQRKRMRALAKARKALGVALEED